MKPDQDVLALEQTRRAPEMERQATETLTGFLRKYSRSLIPVLPPELKPERWSWLIVNELKKNPALASVTPVSFINSVMLAASLGLEIRSRSAYLVPFSTECQLLIDYRGKIDLAAKAGVTVHPPQLVRAGEEFNQWFDENGLHFIHRPNKTRAAGDPEPEVVCAYVMAENREGKRIIEIMSVADIERVRARAKTGRARPYSRYGKQHPGLTLADIRALDIEALAYNDPRRVPWVTDWDQMAKKTVVHRLFNSLPQSRQMAVSQDIDSAVEMGASMPVAEPLADVLMAIDPADNKPLIDAGDGSHEAQQDVAARKMAREVTELPDPLEVQDKYLRQGGKLYARNEDNTAWRTVSSGPQTDGTFIIDK